MTLRFVFFFRFDMQKRTHDTHVFPSCTVKKSGFLSEGIESSWTCTHRYYPCAYTAYMYELIRVNSQIKVTGENVPTFAAKFELPSVK